MKTQISRVSHQPSKRYSGIYQQQGRMVLDADWNELVDLVKGWMARALRDVVGDGLPLRALDGGGRPTGATQEIYVDGVAAPVQLDLASYGKQQDFPAAPGAPVDGETLYVDVWERSVSALEDPALLDPALGGADTCTRTQVLAQVKRAPKGMDPLDPKVNPSVGTAVLDVERRDPTLSNENYLFRVEVHDVRPPLSNPSRLTLKWSSENGAEACIAGQAPPGFEGPFVYETFSAASERALGVHLTPLGAAWAPKPLSRALPLAASDTVQFVRRWDGYCVLEGGSAGLAVVEARDAGDDLTAGRARLAGSRLTLDLRHLTIALDLAGASVVPGDHWMVPVRAGSGTRQLAKRPPDGIRHRHVRAGTVAKGALQLDEKLPFPSLAALKSRDARDEGARFVGAAARMVASKAVLAAGTVASQLQAIAEKLEDVAGRLTAHASEAHGLAEFIAHWSVAANGDLSCSDAPHRIKNLLAPAEAGDVATKGYVDSRSAGEQISPSCGSPATSTDYVDVPKLAVTVNTAGRPVLVILQGDPDGDACMQSGTSTMYMRIVRGTMAVSNWWFRGGSDWHPISFTALDTPPAGTHVYKVQIKGGGQFKQARLVAVPL